MDKRIWHAAYDRGIPPSVDLEEITIVQMLARTATNHPDILDYALFRRFDDVVEFDLPSQPLIIKLLKIKLAAFKKSRIMWKQLAKLASGLSYAHITNACEDAIKDAIINDRDIITNKDLSKPLSERKVFINKQLSSGS